ncbi:ATP-dependent DNA ligase LigD phosphoesterase module /ATP-dependent DNA ligase LigD polymerase module [Sphingomonas sp. PP-F2F-G114-C0414]|uniref:DNA ligase D n=1 Tax=Sphingomonas sp. PP-F2F-G114-C0414 TaxID=2135662 RepID=UPI000EF96222|nr:DNA ligase D [Sphingomonas sp. PP-F2F-G114-C0414]RMB34395.1 ATP-dependent DNA ligase LigD phosphoesterase module /ATP-dependent DNA ligase LigD polymerase module [Sphingomonas sp. PP-F2F-G114-C0414]
MVNDPLALYNAKRNFTKTAEPAGTLAPGNGNSFMVQKHDATRLHWDFRLEIDGVLKSWAVTRGPSLDPNEKRLAVRTEDHPLSYATFEGTIPAGEYGGGTVMLWDRGTWSPIKGKSAKDLDKGHLHFVLDGERMKGEWLLIRLKPRAKEKRENWLLRKIDDAAAGGTDTLVEEALTSVSTGRTMVEIEEGKSSPARGGGPAKLVEGAGRKSTASRKGVASAKPPFTTAKGPGGPPPRAGEEFRDLQLCTLVDAVPTGSAWLHEVKYDGYRALISVANGKAKVFTRTGLDWTDKFAAIADAAAQLPVKSALIDGEIVAFKDGHPDFSTLKDAISAGGDMTLFAFDLLELDGEDLTGLSNLDRKARLQPLIPENEDRLRYSDHVIGAGEQLFETMCREGLEGIVSKRADAPYAGKRTKAWLKVKCTHRQEFVIVGWLPSDKKRGFKSLLLGVREGKGYRYAGKVGTGFDQALMDEIRDKLDALDRKTPTVEAPKAAVRGAKWVTPKLVAEVAFAEVTPDGVLRHSSFIGLREDKAAKDVVAETPAPLPDARPETSIKVSSRDRVIFDRSDVTKGDLADYYVAVSGIMLPVAGNRPISLVRCPQGRSRACFFQKHDAGSFGDAVHQVPIREKDGSTEDYLYVDDADGLVACVQMGTIEFHGWGSSNATLEKPDRLIFDLDPDEGLDFGDTKKAAEHLKNQLAELGLVSFPMLSGGKGVHVVVPLTPDAEWPAVKDFADRFARAMAGADPDRFVATMAKAKRKGRIFIDWLRNQRGATAVMPYSARARAGAPVAAPVSWTELRDIETAARWGVRDGAELIARAGSRALAGWGVADQVLPDL